MKTPTSGIVQKRTNRRNGLRERQVDIVMAWRLVADMNEKNQSMVNGSRITVRILTRINILKEDGRQAGGTSALMMYLSQVCLTGVTPAREDPELLTVELETDSMCEDGQSNEVIGLKKMSRNRSLDITNLLVRKKTVVKDRGDQIDGRILTSRLSMAMINTGATLVRHRSVGRGTVVKKIAAMETPRTTTGVDAMVEDVTDRDAEAIYHRTAMEEVLMMAEDGIRTTVRQMKMIP